MCIIGRQTGRSFSCFSKENFKDNLLEQHEINVHLNMLRLFFMN